MSPFYPNCSVGRGAAAAPAADALNVLVVLESRLWHAADAGRVEVCLVGLDAAQAAQLLVALLLPLGNEKGISVAVLEQPLVQLPADGLLLVVEFVDVAAPLVRDLEDGPLCLVLGDVVGRRVLRVLHLVGEHQQVLFDVAEALGGRLALGCGADRGHDVVVAVLSVLKALQLRFPLCQCKCFWNYDSSDSRNSEC